MFNQTMKIYSSFLDILLKVIDFLWNWPTSTENQGRLALVTLFLTILSIFIAWRSFFVPLKLERLSNEYKQKRMSKLLKLTLLNDLQMNLNFVSQIQASHEKNIDSSVDKVSIPNYGLRTGIIEKFIDPNTITYLQNEMFEQILFEIYSQINSLNGEYKNWRAALLDYYHISVKANIDYYNLISKPILNYVEPLMKDMITFWVLLLLSDEEISKDSNRPNIHNLYLEIKRLQDLKEIHIYSHYKASNFKSILNEVPENSIFVCWENDWVDAEICVIELKDKLNVFDENYSYIH